MQPIHGYFHATKSMAYEASKRLLAPSSLVRFIAREGRNCRRNVASVAALGLVSLSIRCKHFGFPRTIFVTVSNVSIHILLLENTLSSKQETCSGLCGSASQISNQVYLVMFLVQCVNKKFVLIHPRMLIKYFEPT